MKTSHDRKAFEQHYNVDTVIVGGGVTGVVAAVAAARLGVNTLLIDNRPVLGGVSSSECNFNADGRHVVGAPEYVNRNARETGIIEELRLEARYMAANGWARHWSILLRDFCEREKNLTLLLNTEVYDVETENQEIKSIKARTLNSETDVEAKAPVFIDCSGDSFLAFRAGAEYRMGREGSEEFAESLAPDKPDTKTMGSSILFEAVDTGAPVPFKAPQWAYKIKSDEDLPYRIHNNPRNGWWWLEYGGEIDTIKDNEKIYRTLLSVLFGIWDHIKNSGEHHAENYVINWISNITGKRESRRLMGDIILTQNDVCGHTDFHDTVAYGGWPIDIHASEGVFGKSHPGSTPPFVFPGIYRIPFRCLYSRNIKNLMMAGRNISVTHVALGTTRVTATCALCGQAAGTAAFLAKKYHKNPKEIAQEHIGELKSLLASNDVEIPEYSLSEKKNADTEISVKASSTMLLDIQAPDSELSLIAPKKNTCDPHSDGYDPCDVPPEDRRRAQMFPVNSDRIDSITILMNSENNSPVTINAHLRCAGKVNDFSSTEDIAISSAKLIPGKRQSLCFDFDIEVDSEKLYWIVLDEEPGVSVCISSRYIPGIYMKADGCYFDSSNFCFKVLPVQRLFEPENIINGLSRAGKYSNMWISAPDVPMPQYIEMDFHKSIKLQEVEIIFDTNLNRLVLSGAPPECVKDYELSAINGETVTTLASITDNYQRRRIHRFSKPVYAEKLKLTINSTNGDSSARVYDIRLNT